MNGLRGIAVLMVLLYHAFVSGILPLSLDLPGLSLDFPLPVLDGGLTGVEIFFFISGFVLFYPYAQHIFEGRPLQTLTHYAERRMAKIVPSYVLVLIVMTIVCPRNIEQPDSLAVHFVKHLFFLHGFWEASLTSIIGPLWTLAVEVEFYLLFPFIARCFMRAPLCTMGTMIAISVGYRVFLSIAKLDYTFFWTNQLPDFFDIFGFGCLAAYSLVRSRNLHASGCGTLTKWTATSCFGVLIFYGLLGSLIRVPGGAPTWHWLNDSRDIIGLTLYLTCVGITRGSALIRDILGNPILLWFSDISYNLYLWHMNVFYLYLNHISHWIAPLPYGISLNAVFGLALPVGIAWCVTHWVEKPILRKGLLGILRIPTKWPLTRLASFEFGMGSRRLPCRGRTGQAGERSSFRKRPWLGCALVIVFVLGAQALSRATRISDERAREPSMPPSTME